MTRAGTTTFYLWPRTVALRGSGSRNLDANRAAVKRMTPAERLCGMTVRELDARQAAQRRRVLGRIA